MPDAGNAVASADEIALNDPIICCIIPTRSKIRRKPPWLNYW